jgi:preprotein translocase SecE subunit
VTNRALRRRGKRKRAKRSVDDVAKTPPAAAATAIPKRESRTGGFKPTSLVPRFALDIATELRKVVWPSREDTIYLTVVVVIVTLIIGAILGAIDIGFGWLIDNYLLQR